MPEGHTIFRTAATLDRWLTGREVSGARTTVVGLPASKLVGQRVMAVEARGKHLLIRFSEGQVLHTHMKMAGAWHVYSVGDRWQKPTSQARFVLEAGERVAVCFNAPVVELLAARGELQHPGLVNLGPDVLRPPIDMEEVHRRASVRPPALPVGEVLLDQQVVSGIGNIWRCEALFVARINPWTPQGAVPDVDFERIIVAASDLMQRSANGEPHGGFRVYKHARQPCVRCSTPIKSGRLGAQPRSVYWCPKCQPSD